MSAAEAAPSLPAKFPKFDSVTYTVLGTQAPTEIVDGYYEGGEVGARRGEERPPGCRLGDENRTFVHITNRPGKPPATL